MGELRSRLFETGRYLSRALPRGSVARAQWFSLGIKVLGSSDLTSDGGCMYRPKNSIVLVKSDNNYARQRFTTAHEMGHLLLGRVRDAGRISLSSTDEERLCDEFASALLLPREEVRNFLGEAGSLSSPAAVLDIAHHFGVNVRPVGIALAQIWSDERRLLLVAELKGHQLRPSEVDYRVAVSAGRPYKYIPSGKRLRSLGLVELADWAQHGNANARGRGKSMQARIPFWAPEGRRRTGFIVGEVTWDAMALNWGIITVLGLDKAKVQWSSSTKKGVERDLR